MAVLLSWKGDGLSTGNLTTSSAGTGDNAPDGVSGALGIVPSGDRAPRIATPASAPAYARWNHTLTGTAAYRWYAEYTGLTSASFVIAEGRSATDSASRWRIDLAGTAGSPPGQVRLRNGSAAAIGTWPSVACPLNTLVRWEVVLSADTLTIWLYTGHGSVPITSISGSLGVGITVGGIRLGNSLSGVVGPTFYMDDFVATDTATQIGPAVVSEVGPALSMWNGTTEEPLTIEGVWNGSSVVAATVEG